MSTFRKEKPTPKMKNKKNKTKKIIVSLAVGLFFSCLYFQTASAEFNYTLLESFPGFFKGGTGSTPMTDLPTMILALYKFGIWTVGIAGMFMLVVGGFMYMASAGNTSTAGSARKIISDALLGIVAALGAYLIMYVINPDLTRIDFSNFKAVDVTEFGGPTGTGNPVPISGGCTSDQMLAKIKTAAQGKMDPCLVFAMLNTESGCTTNAQSRAGACGVAQIMPTTAGISCEELKNNPDLSITKGVGLLSAALGSGKIRGNISSSGNAFNQAAKDLYASYNGGPGCLDASKDCNSSMKNSYNFPYVKWDCPINPGGYTETVIATARFLNSYNSCKNNTSIQGKLN